MGQSSSKQQDTSDSTQNPVAGASTDPDSITDDPSSSQPGSSRSASIRKSILNLVKPSNIRSRVSSITSQPATDLRRSWRNSILRRKDDSSPPTSASSTAGPSTPSLLPTDKGKKPERIVSDDADLEEDTLTPVDLEQQQPSTSEILQEGQSTSHILETLEPVISSTDDDETNTLYVSDPGEPQPEQHLPAEGPEPALPSQPQPQPQQPSSPPSLPRQFPPPGTLVVVQGIVHTTDVSRNNNQGTESNSTSTSTLRPVPPDTNPESGTSRTRNRLSALLRPRSASSRPPSTIINEPVPSVTTTPPTEPVWTLSSSVESDVSEVPAQATSSSNEPADVSEDQLPPLEDPPPLPITPPNHTSSISSSSIDVLGTLLRYISLYPYTKYPLNTLF